jgi:hypothetical protein
MDNIENNEDDSVIPTVPDEIIKAINNGTLAVFVGAGVSIIAGLPSWSGLAKIMMDDCHKQELYTFSEKEIILNKITDNKQIITIARNKYKEKDERLFFEMIDKCLQKPANVTDDGKHIFDFLKKTSSLVLTTNADNLLHKYFESDLIHWDVNDVKTWFERSKLVHLHGLIGFHDSLVFTVDQYLDRYRNKDFQNYLEDVFKKYTILFIGYGLSEFELLDFLRMKNNAGQHFALIPYFRYQEPAIEGMKTYYDLLGIQQIPYFIDKKGYNILADVLDSWYHEFEDKTKLPPKRIEEIKGLAHKEPKNSLPELLQLIDQTSYLSGVFFKELIDSEYSVDWILALPKEYFDPSKNNTPVREETKDGNKFLHANYWEALGAFSEIFRNNKNDENLKDLSQNLINDIAADSIQNSEKLKNWRTNSIISRIFYLQNPKNYSTSVYSYLEKICLDSFSRDAFIREFIRNQNEIIEKWEPEYIFEIIKIFFNLDLLIEDKYENHYEELTEQCCSSISKIIPKELYDFFLQKIKEVDCRYYDMGSF